MSLDSKIHVVHLGRRDGYIKAKITIVDKELHNFIKICLRHYTSEVKLINGNRKMKKEFKEKMTEFYYRVESSNYLGIEIDRFEALNFRSGFQYACKTLYTEDSESYKLARECELFFDNFWYTLK